MQSEGGNYSIHKTPRVLKTKRESKKKGGN